MFIAFLSIFMNNHSNEPLGIHEKATKSQIKRYCLWLKFLRLMGSSLQHNTILLTVIYDCNGVMQKYFGNFF